MFRLPPRWLFVRVATSEGIVGWGEGSLEGHTEAVEGAFEELRSKFVGKDADAIQDIWREAYMGGFYRGGPVLMVCLFLLVTLAVELDIHLVCFAERNLRP